MGTEIERKFLIINNNWKNLPSEQTDYTQGYFTTNEKCSIRIRVAGDVANINIKSATLGIYRSEYDYPIPVKDAREILDDLCIHPLIEKTRYKIQYDNHTWEVDVFSGENEGLIVAEIELDSVDEEFTKPDWIGEEVSDDPRYYNVCLVGKPYKSWSD